MDKRVLAIIVVIGLVVLAFAFLAPAKQATLTEQQIKAEIEDANYCNVNEDCAPVSFACPFDCNIFVNQKESTKINALLHSFVPTEQNSKMCSMIGACIEPVRVECKNNKCEAVYQTQKTEIGGTVTLASGNCMPGALSKTHPCTQTGVSRTVFIREPATSADMAKTNLVVQTTSDANGLYQVELEPGTYSIFVEDDSKEYCNQFGEQNEVCQITVKAGSLTEYNIKIDKAVY